MNFNTLKDIGQKELARQKNTSAGFFAAPALPAFLQELDKYIRHLTRQSRHVSAMNMKQR